MKALIKKGMQNQNIEYESPSTNTHCFKSYYLTIFLGVAWVVFQKKLYVSNFSQQKLIASFM